MSDHIAYSDKLFADYQQKVQKFQFDDKVARVFPDMIKRSVPGYENIITLIGLFAQAHATSNTNCYDLGCSLGASTMAILENLGNTNCRVIGVDNSEAMGSQCAKNLREIYPTEKYQIICDDIENISLNNASVVVLNFTLQFIPKSRRDKLIKHIYQAIVPGGVLILSEKICFSNALKNHLFTELHYGFKKTQGYSDLEISQKRSALENTLIPESSESHLNRLKLAGFSDADLCFQCLNFASFFAIKS